jgi:16S rRNA (cytosine(1402)-N(4))-methyltransferase
VLARAERPITTTAELKRIIDAAKGGGPGSRGSRDPGGPAGRAGRARAGAGRREGRVDPATRVFQALRIAVNQELAGLETAIEQAVKMMASEGRLVVISYHSLEDRIVKNTLRDLVQGEIDRVTGRPLAESQLIAALTRKPIRPTPEEVEWNPRARSARLRAARRL